MVWMTYIPLHRVEVPLVDGVHAQEPGLSVEAGLASLADGHDSGPGLDEHAVPAPASARLSLDKALAGQVALPPIIIEQAEYPPQDTLEVPPYMSHPCHHASTTGCRS